MVHLTNRKPRSQLRAIVCKKVAVCRRAIATPRHKHRVVLNAKEVNVVKFQTSTLSRTSGCASNTRSVIILGLAFSCRQEGGGGAGVRQKGSGNENTQQGGAVLNRREVSEFEEASVIIIFVPKYKDRHARPTK